MFSGTPDHGERSSGYGCGSAQSVKRIMREFHETRNCKNPYWTAAPLNEEDPFEWHFTVRGPSTTEFEGGIYHGRIVLPQNYPLGPPNFTILTQNGRFEVGRKVCLSASSYHPELWQPAWGIRTMLDALHAFFATPADGSLHSLDWPVEVRRQLAEESVRWTCPVCNKSNNEIVQEFCEAPTPTRPVLPGVMIPPMLSQTCSYFRGPAGSSTREVSSPAAAATTSPPVANNVLGVPGSKPDALVPPPFAKQDLPGMTSGQSKEDPLGSASVTASAAAGGSTAAASLAERRERRRINTRAPSSLNLKIVLQILILHPLVACIAPILDSKTPVSRRLMRVCDIVCTVTLISSVFLIVSIGRRPGALFARVLMTDGVV